MFSRRGRGGGAILQQSKNGRIAPEDKLPPPDFIE
jgi:hypothetical protein